MPDSLFFIYIYIYINKTAQIGVFFSLFLLSFVIFREALKKINSSSSASHMFAVLCIQRHLPPIYCQKMLAWICINFASMNTSQILCWQICSPPSHALRVPSRQRGRCPTKSLLYLPLFS